MWHHLSPVKVKRGFRTQWKEMLIRLGLKQKFRRNNNWMCIWRVAKMPTDMKRSFQANGIAWTKVWRSGNLWMDSGSCKPPTWHKQSLCIGDWCKWYWEIRIKKVMSEIIRDLDLFREKMRKSKRYNIYIYIYMYYILYAVCTLYIHIYTYTYTFSIYIGGLWVAE